MQTLLKFEISPTGRITLAPDNTDINDAVAECVRLGLRSITFAADYSLTSSQLEQFIASFKILTSRYFQAVKNGDIYDITNISTPILAIATNKKAISHCNAGLTYLAVSADGKLYRCPRFTVIAGYSIGHIEHLSSQDVTSSIGIFARQLGSSAATRSAACGDCPFVYLCGGTCYHHSKVSSGLEHNPVSFECYYRKVLFHEVLTGICRLTTEERRNYILALEQLWKAY